VSAWCREFNTAWSWYKGNASAVCVFEMADGAIFTYRGSWCAEGVNTTWECDWRLVGRRGTAIWNGKEAPWAEITPPREKHDFINKGTRVEAPLDWTGREGHPGCLDEMFASLLEGRPAETECTDNLKTVEMVFGAIESSRTALPSSVPSQLKTRPWRSPATTYIPHESRMPYFQWKVPMFSSMPSSSLTTRL
jgi:predicted dehydrogenase